LRNGHREQAHSYKRSASYTIFMYATAPVGVSLLAMKATQS